MYYTLRNSYALSNIVKDSARYHSHAKYNGLMTLEDHLPVLKMAEKNRDMIYWVDEGPGRSSIFRIDGNPVKFIVPQQLYVAIRAEEERVKFGDRIPAKVLMRQYRRLEKKKEIKNKNPKNRRK